MPNEIDIEKCLNLTAQLVLAAITSGKFSAETGQATAKYFDEVFAQVCDCADLTSEEFIREYSSRKISQQ